MSVKERLKEFIRYERLSVRKFERIVGLSYGYVNNMRVSMQPDKVEMITKQFPNLSPGWLMTGEGTMLREPKKDYLIGSTSRYAAETDAVYDQLPAPVAQEIKHLRELLMVQHETIDAKDGHIKALEKHVENLEKLLGDKIL